MAEKLKVLIIGAGNKGATGPVSHAEAFTNNPAFKVVGFVDNDETKREQAIARWGGQGFPDISSALSELGSVDVAVVATPDSTHEIVIHQLIGAPVRLIFAEKPFAQSSEKAKWLLNGIKSCNQALTVNYTRRFVQRFQYDVPVYYFNERSGKFLGGCAFYTKGLHNLCHWVDTFLMIGINPEVIKYIEIDRSKLNVFEAFLYFEGGRFSIMQHGGDLTFTPVIQREDFPEEHVLDEMDKWGGRNNAFLDKPMQNAVQNIADHLTNGTPLLSPGENAVKVLEICERILA